MSAGAEAERDILTLELGDLKETLESTKRNGRRGRGLQNNLKKVEAMRASFPPLSLPPPRRCCHCRCHCHCMVVVVVLPVVRRHRQRWWALGGGDDWMVSKFCKKGGGCTVVRRHTSLPVGWGVSNLQKGEGDVPSCVVVCHYLRWGWLVIKSRRGGDVPLLSHVVTCGGVGISNK